MRQPAEALAGAAASAILLSMAHRPGFSGLWGLVALTPLFLCAPSSGRRSLTVMTAAAVAATGASFPMFEGTLSVLPWSFPVLVILFLPQVLLPLLVWLRLGGNSGGPVAALAAAATWLACESMAGAPVWGSFASFYSLGYTQFDTALMGLARLSGTGLISFLLVFCSCSLAQLRTRDLRAFITCIMLAPPLLMLANPRFIPERSVSPAHVTLVQPAFSGLEYELAGIDPHVASSQVRKLALLGSATGFSAVTVWPETVLAPLVRPEAVRDMIPPDTALFTGRLELAGPDTFNSVMLSAARGWETVQRKVMPVPVLEWPGIAPGLAGGTIALPGVPVLGSLVCLDSAHAWPALRAARAGAGLLVVLSNSEFAVLGQTPELHLRVTAFRAVELGIPVVFAASSGPSGLIDALGTVLNRTSVGEQTALRVSIPDRLESTPYLRYGNWFTWLACPPLLLMLPIRVRFRVPRGYCAIRAARAGRPG